jgi:hypothetical protein
MHKNIPKKLIPWNLTFALIFAAVPSALRADVVVSSDFSTNPAPADPRFTFNSADGTLTAHYNTSLPTDKLVFPFPAGRSFTAADSFNVATRFKINSANFSADPFGFAQIALGLLNTTTTGNDRSGGIGHDFSATPVNYGTSGNTYDLVAFDYFPNVSPTFASPTLSPTIISSKTGTEPAFSDVYAPFGAQSALNDPGESAPALDTFYNTLLSYNAQSRRIAISISSDSAPLLINAGGGPDGDPFTIDYTVPSGINFNVNAYALTLWTDSYADFGPSVVADVVFDSFSVSAVPEPSALLLTFPALLLLAHRRRR